MAPDGRTAGDKRVCHLAVKFVIYFVLTWIFDLQIDLLDLRLFQETIVNQLFACECLC